MTPTSASLLEESRQQEKFDRLAAQWKKDVFLLSKISAKVLHSAYQKIIGMGPVAVPLILKDLRENGPNHWFWALQAITEENPVPEGLVGNIAGMTEAWLQWGNNKGYLTNYPKSTGKPFQI